MFGLRYLDDVDMNCILPSSKMVETAGCKIVLRMDEDGLRKSLGGSAEVEPLMRRVRHSR